MRSLRLAERETLLQRAGLLRFEQKTHAFVEELHRIGEGSANALPPCGRPSFPVSGPYNACLIPALAEGLAYGRDRAFFRAAGQHLLGQIKHIPEPLGRAPAPSPLDARRLNVLRKLIAREQDVWSSLRCILCQLQECLTEADGRPFPNTYRVAVHEDTILRALRDYFCSLGLSLARTDILLCNVVFPFAAAVALVEHDTVLEEQVQRLYAMHPGLSSNTITRMMCAQLLLADEPRGSCQQQGLQYIYQQTCQAKNCVECIMGRTII
ncbi:MAG: hypothetical protein NVSMB38_32970 [Ktedonobacteraceae bacterium]